MTIANTDGHIFSFKLIKILYSFVIDIITKIIYNILAIVIPRFRPVGSARHLGA